jgi:cell division protein FtsQ
MRQQAYKVKSKQVLQQARAKTLKSLKLKFAAFAFLSIISYYIFPYKLVNRLCAIDDIYYKINLFILNEIEVVGNEKFDRNELIALTGLDQVKNIFQADIHFIKSELEKNSWIDEVIVRRLLPSKIRLEIKERKPRAIWWNKQHFFLVDCSGNIIEEIPEKKVTSDYLLVIGTTAPGSYGELLDKLFQIGIVGQVNSLIKIGDRRWDIYLNGGTLVKLPEQNIEKALAILAKILIERKKNLSLIDLRLPDKLYLEF